jgi:uncharacterized protein (TIGR02217 family)
MAAPVIDQIQFPTEISRGAVGGSRKPTLFVEAPSGREQRIKLWSAGRRVWTLSLEGRDLTRGAALVAFWEARDGGARGFRFKDWNEFSVTDQALAPTGAPTVQLVRTYTSGLITRTTNIYAPVASPAATLKKNGGAFGGFTLDTTTGLVTLTALNTKAITAITQATSAVVTVGAAHGFVTNDLVYVSGVLGMTQINGSAYAVTGTGANTITLAVNSLGFSAYTSGGTAAKYLTTTDTLSWTGEHDYPARFDLQAMEMGLPEAFIREWVSVRVKELTG